VQNYVEPFFGSGAVLLGVPSRDGRLETVNDLDGLLVNFWRAVRKNPFAVAQWADDLISEADLSARHLWLLERGQELAARLQADPDYCEAQAAGWWCAGACAWIGSGWCSGTGPWTRERDAAGAWQLIHLGDKGRGINRQLIHLGNKGRGIYAWFAALAERLRSVRVACGDWARVVGDSVTWLHGLTGVFLDPPYASDRCETVYANDSMDVAHAVAAWAREAGQRKDMRIALCGYAGEHDLPGWEQVAWKARGGYGSQGEGTGRANSASEVIWFSPHCLGGRQLGLF
jgi:DNA adenine methylase